MTNDRTPTWAWTVEEVNPITYNNCDIYDETNDRNIFDQYGCASPLNFEAELPDGEYEFDIELSDKAGNYAWEYRDFEVDNVAPTVVSAKPTGRLVRPSSDVVVIFDDRLYRSNTFVNIYKRGSNTPLAVYRYAYYDPDTDEPVGIELSPKSYLKRDTRYTVKVTTGVNDGANNLEAPKTWSFKTRR